MYCPCQISLLLSSLSFPPFPGVPSLSQLICGRTRCRLHSACQDLVTMKKSLSALAVTPDEVRVHHRIILPTHVWCLVSTVHSRLASCLASQESREYDCMYSKVQSHPSPAIGRGTRAGVWQMSHRPHDCRNRLATHGAGNREGTRDREGKLTIC